MVDSNISLNAKQENDGVEQVIASLMATYEDQQEISPGKPSFDMADQDSSGTENEHNEFMTTIKDSSLDD